MNTSDPSAFKSAPLRLIPELQYVCGGRCPG
jgi:hypothetical protein